MLFTLAKRWLAASIPATLHASCEPRQEPLKTYQRLSFGMWINFSVDTIYVRLFLDHNNGTGISFEREVRELLQSDLAFKTLQFLAFGRIHGTNLCSSIIDTWYWNLSPTLGAEYHLQRRRLISRSRRWRIY